MVNLIISSCSRGWQRIRLYDLCGSKYILMFALLLLLLLLLAAKSVALIPLTSNPYFPTTGFKTFLPIFASNEGKVVGFTPLPPNWKTMSLLIWVITSDLSLLETTLPPAKLSSSFDHTNPTASAM